MDTWDAMVHTKKIRRARVKDEKRGGMSTTMRNVHGHSGRARTDSNTVNINAFL